MNYLCSSLPVRSTHTSDKYYICIKWMEIEFKFQILMSVIGTHCVELILSISSLNFIHFIAVWMMFRAQLSCVMHQWRCFTYYLFVISEQREIFKFLLVICLSLNYYESLERYTIYYDFSFIACCAPCLACLSYNKSSASAFWSNAFFFFFFIINWINID